MSDPAAPQGDPLRGYAEAAAELVPRFESFDSAEVLAPVLDLLPGRGARAADLGAGTGRDAAFLARRGLAVVAAEPVAELREPGRALHGDLAIDWRDARLPDAQGLEDLARRMDLVLANGVLHHLDLAAQARAMTAIARLVAPGGLVALGLRHGPGPQGRPAWPLDADRIAGLAAAEGLEEIRRQGRESLQAANRAARVTWTWLALRRKG